MKTNTTTKLGITLAGVLALIGAKASADITLNTVIIGDPGNLADTSTGFGAVSYIYAIGTYEVSNAEYTAFLNAVDASGTNPNAIYNNTGMNSDASNGGITFTSGASIGTKYAAKAGFANKPVTYVGTDDAKRFANWLNNGQGAASTETGAYTMSLGGFAPRNGGATWFLTSEDEWYKAAYYDPVSAGADAGGTANYWLYPTQSDTLPTGAPPNGSANQANYGGTVGAVTVGGAYGGSASHYGTFDQGGDVWEVNESMISGNGARRGSSWQNAGTAMASSQRHGAFVGGEFAGDGFRIATTIVPEPASALLLLGSGAMLLLRRRRRA